MKEKLEKIIKNLKESREILEGILQDQVGLTNTDFDTICGFIDAQLLFTLECRRLISKIRDRENGF